ncbi:MAG: aldo/keto reductase [Anaerovoracaceae bacterium]|jgi:aryl-alcohol dehydrogenase-like predicted oxidoreductase/NAD-dependent dihydropyrimidine dehydrogenase PreA subunit
MDYPILGQTGIQVSRIGMGVLEVGRTQLNMSIPDSASLIRYAMDLGISFFDTAEYYETYPHLRAALRGDYRTTLRDGSGRHIEPVIASKSLTLSAAGMEAAIEEARRELDRDVIDIFLLHEVRVHGDFAARIGAWEALQQAKADGRVRAIGVSTHHIDVAEAMVDVPECDIVFPLINKFGLGIRRGDEPGSADEMAAAIAALAKRGKGVFAMKAFGGGNLTGHYIECLDYVNELPGVDSLMLGFGRPGEILDAVHYIEGRLPENYQPDISKKRIHIDPGDCEACGACIKRCPNHAIAFNESGIAAVNHDVCLTCGYCAPVCPVRAIILY